MKNQWQTMLLCAAIATLAACSSTGQRSATSMSGSSGTTGTTGTSASSGSIDTSGNNTRVTPPPVAGPSSTGGVIDDRVNSNTDVPGQTR